MSQRPCRRTVSIALIVSVATALPAAAARKNVYLLRGFMDVSAGLDQLAGKLNKRRIGTSVANHGAWSTLADQAIADYKARRTCSIILVGHSLGADATIAFANHLKDAKVPVALIVTFDPYSYRQVPSNVKRVVNYYRSGTIWGNPYRTESGGRVKIRNVDLGGDETINHFNIERLPKLHRNTLRDIRRARTRCNRRR